MEVGDRRLGGAGTDRRRPCSSSRRMLQVAKDSEVLEERFSESLLWSFFCFVRRFWNHTLTWGGVGRVGEDGEGRDRKARTERERGGAGEREARARREREIRERERCIKINAQARSALRSRRPLPGKGRIPAGTAGTGDSACGWEPGNERQEPRDGSPWNGTLRMRPQGRDLRDGLGIGIGTGPQDQDSRGPQAPGSGMGPQGRDLGDGSLGKERRARG